IKVIYPGHETKWYNLGEWSSNAVQFPRHSIKNQQDADGTVSTDTLQMNRAGGIVRVRLTVHRATNIEGLTLLGLALWDNKVDPEALSADKGAWGNTVAVPERSQGSYPEGITAWCSPTAVSMLLSFWSRQLHRPDLEHDVPEVARAVDDP